MATDWDKEMKKIDRQLESISDDALISTSGKKPPAEKAKAGDVQRTTTTLGVFARLMLAVVLGLAMLFWPYSARCGPGLFAFLFASGMVVVGGVWSAVWTWRHCVCAGAHPLAAARGVGARARRSGDPATYRLRHAHGPASCNVDVLLTPSPNFSDITA